MLSSPTPVIRETMRVLMLLSLFRLFQLYYASTTEQQDNIVVLEEDIGNAAIIDVSGNDSDDSEVEAQDSALLSVSRSSSSSSSSNIEVIDVSEEPVDKDDKEADKYDASVQLSRDNTVEEDTWLFPHTIGIRNHVNNCYASALIACLYNIPVVQKAIFDEVSSASNLRKEESIVAALATIFYKMRFGRSFIDLEPFFIPAIKKTFFWEFGGIECVLEFWNQLSEALPESLFQFEVQENRLRKSDNAVIKSAAQKSNLILVAPSKKYRNIEEFLANEFVDEEAEDFIIEPEEFEEYRHLFPESTTVIEEKMSIPSKTTLTILNCPEVLIFGVKRVRWNVETNSSEFDSTPLGFPEKLAVNSEEYTIVGNVGYDEERIHYYAQNYDLLDDQWYIHDDKLVTRIPDTEEDFMVLAERFIQNSSMVFYVKSSSLESFRNKESVELSEEVVTKLKSRRTSQPAPVNTLKRKRKDKVEDDFEEDTKATAKVTEDTKEVTNDLTEAKVVKKVRGPCKKRIEKVLTEKEEEQEKEKLIVELPIVNNSKKQRTKRVPKSDSEKVKLGCFNSSYGLVPDFRLGSKQFLFARADRNAVLESILVAFASHPALVTKLFEVAKKKAPSDVEFKFVLVVLRILTGQMAVSTKELATILAENYSVDFMNFGNAWRRISEIISPEISSIPDLKIVTYKEDEPISIETIPKCNFYSLQPFKTMKIPRDTKLSGPAYDAVVDVQERTFKRNILKCSDEGIVLAVPIERIFKNPSNDSYIYDSNPVEISTGSYLIHGFTGIDPKGTGPFAIFSDHLSQPRFLLYSAGIPKYSEKTAATQEMIVQLMKTQSALFLLTKAEGFYAEMPMLSHVPRILFDELNNLD